MNKYLDRSLAASLNLREMRKTLEDSICNSKFGNFKTLSFPIPPVSLLKPTEVADKLKDLTNTLEYELLALEVSQSLIIKGTPSPYRTEFQLLVTEFQLLVTEFQLLVTEFQPLATKFQLLVT